MSYVPPARLLHGVAYPVAECYGKPHVLCRYSGEGVNTHRLFDGAPCAVCGRPATNAHHWPPKGKATSFGLRFERLKPALIALCGSGTTGCHGEWHSGRYRALWRWDSDELAREWWEGSMLEDHGPHDMALYGYGCWELYDMWDGRIWRMRL